MDKFYKIEKRYNDYICPESGVYFGDLKEILSRISDGQKAEGQTIYVEKLHFKFPDKSKEYKGVEFYCLDDELKKELNFAQAVSEDLFKYIPKEVIEKNESCFCIDKGIRLNVGDTVEWYESICGEICRGKIVELLYESGVLMVLTGYTVFHVRPDEVINGYKGDVNI